MEREPVREIPRERIREQRLESLVLEILGEPEQLQELLSFWRYIGELEASVESNLPRREREEELLAAHQEVTGMPMPGASPPSTQVIPVGEHMDVSVIFSASTCWPDQRQTRLVLSDGALVVPQTQIGIIDFYRNMGRLGRSGSLVEFSRGLITSALGSLHQLARYYNSLGEQAQAVEAFSGMSHLARLAGRFGFTVVDISDARQRDRATNVSRSIAERVVGDNSSWDRLREKYKPAKIAYISSQELLKRFL